MNSTPIKRGRESQDHEQLKIWVAKELKKAGFDLVHFEAHNCDVSGYKSVNGSNLVYAAEVEMSPKHVLENAKRDFAHGAHRLLVITPNERVRRLVECKFQKHISAELLSRITVFTVSPESIQKDHN